MRVEIGLLGGFTVSIDGAPVPAGRWRRRHATALVKLLAPAPPARLHRDRVIDTHWPDVDLGAALPACTRPRTSRVRPSPSAMPWC